MKLEITIPVYNEEKRLENGFLKLYHFCQDQKIDFSIVIADNGSRDKTVEIANAFCAKYSNVRLISLDQKGVGRALRASWQSSSAEIVGYVDVDLSTDIKHLPEMMTCFEKENIDFVNGSRLLKQSQVIGRKPIREITSRGMNILIQLLLRVKTSDAMCGFKFIKKNKYESLLQTGLLNWGWFFNAEIIIKSEWAGFKIKEIPVTWEDDPNSKVKIVRLSMEYLKNIWQLFKEKNFWIQSRKEAQSRSRDATPI